MYLKSLELRGFKSFADKTELIFRDGITAVVGPNGSGKSNISDAVRWVLGEQSVKQLRGGKMEDVIFAGTQFRKSLGQAQVSITFNNEDGSLKVPYSEVTVTRKLYRSGESEYLLNNNNVRLRDVHEMFMDTGIGKEGYSMIGQGKIEAILSGKPEERRSLIEEAAGIVKYKSRKEEGEKKLKNAMENLERVEDIISTYEERIGPLKEDKEKAEKFIVLDRELKDITTTLLVKDMDDLEDKNKEIIDRKTEIDRKFEEISRERGEHEEKNKTLDDSLSELSELRIRKREEYYNLKSDLEKFESEIKLKKAQRENESSNIIRNRAILDGSDEKSVEIKLEIEKLLKEKQETEDNLTSLNKEIEDIRNKSSENEAGIESLNKEIDSLKEKQDNLRSELRRQEHEISEVMRKKEYLYGKKESAHSNSESYLASLKLNESSRDKVSDSLRIIEEELFKLNEESKEKTENIRNNRESLNSLFESSEKQRREIASIENKIGILKNLEENHEGYNRAVKELMNLLKRKNSAYLKSTSIVGEVIKAKSKYTDAIEAALGGYIQNIITDTDDQAKDLISLLKKNGIGRCTFLPLNIIKATKIPYPSLKNSKALGFASELVEFDEKFRNVVENILGRTLVTTNMDEALKVARETNFRIKIVTLDGDIIASGGAMTGGSSKVKSSILSRKSEIEELEKLLSTEKEKLKSSEAEYQELKNLIDLKTMEIYSLTDLIRSRDIERAKLKERVAGFESEVKKLSGVIGKESQDMESIDKEIRISEGRIEEYNKKSEEIKVEVSEIDSKLIILRENRNRSFEESEDLREELTEKRIHQNKIQSELNGIHEKLVRLEEEKAQILENTRKLSEETLKSEKIVYEIDVFLRSSEENKTNFLKVLEETDKEIESIEMEEVKRKADLKEISGRLTSIRDEYYSVEKEQLKINMSLERYESDKEEILRKLNEDLNLTLAEARENIIEIESRPRAKKRASELRSSISSLGNINLAAIEEYEKVSEHYNFLISQKEDLLKAKEDLLNLIGDMTSKMRSQFKENFASLQVNFRDTFRQLFNGGSGELSISEGDELTGNIEINVQPPGKKLQNINLMSGGEKVLSAIALTFAILRMKPSPFCILDEIEAALDDANVYRYASFLREFSCDTQFILITHRKGTMEAADVLYGVTMEEKGISKIVNVDLEHIKEQG